jgi:hypothetical protein
MTKLLDEVVAAHGGLARWQSLATVQATIVTAGGLWGTKGVPHDLSPRTVRASLHKQLVSILPFGAPDQRAIFTPQRLFIEKAGMTVAERLHPRDAFCGHEQSTLWDPLHRAYFSGCALWNYLTTPFLLTAHGIRVDEVDPLREQSEVWRGLRAWFPQNIATHSEVQDFFFDSQLMLRRHDYDIDVAGGIPIAMLADEHAEADGIRLPTRLRAFRRSPDNRLIPAPMMVSIHTSEVLYTEADVSATRGS